MKIDEDTIEVEIVEYTIQVSGLNKSEREALGARIRKLKRGCESQLIIEYSVDGMFNIKTGLGMRREDRALAMNTLALLVKEQIDAPIWR